MRWASSDKPVLSGFPSLTSMPPHRGEIFKPGLEVEMSFR